MRNICWDCLFRKIPRCLSTCIYGILPYFHEIRDLYKWHFWGGNIFFTTVTWHLPSYSHRGSACSLLNALDDRSEDICSIWTQNSDTAPAASQTSSIMYKEFLYKFVLCISLHSNLSSNIITQKFLSIIYQKANERYHCHKTVYGDVWNKNE